MTAGGRDWLLAHLRFTPESWWNWPSRLFIRVYLILFCLLSFCFVWKSCISLCILFVSLAVWQVVSKASSCVILDYDSGLYIFFSYLLFLSLFCLILPLLFIILFLMTVFYVSFISSPSFSPLSALLILPFLFSLRGTRKKISFSNTSWVHWSQHHLRTCLLRKPKERKFVRQHCQTSGSTNFE